MVKRENYSIGNIGNLSKVQLEILKVLSIWEHNKEKCTLKAIAKKTGYSYHYVSFAISELKERGIVHKNQKGIFFIPEPIRKRIVSELKDIVV